MRRFSIVVLLFTATLHVPFACGLTFALERAGAPRPLLLALVIAASLVLAVRGRVERARADRPLSRSRRLLVEEPYFAHWCATVAALPLSLVCALAVGGHAAISGSPGWLERLSALTLGCYLFALAISTYGVVVRRRWVRVRAIDVHIPGLGARFDGYRIAHLSDLHIGAFTPRSRAMRWAHRVNALDVDLVAFTGDYVTSGSAFHGDIADVLSAVRARDGAIAVLGNHDYFGDAEPLVARISERGVTVLRNEHRTLRRGEDALTIAGCDDTWSRRADVARALAGAPADHPLIALAHDPQLFPELARRGSALVLSGHTHWGQIALPFAPARFNFSRLSYRYHADLYTSGGATLYVSPGLGTSGPPVRLGAPPEITVLRLCRAPAARDPAKDAHRSSGEIRAR